MPEQVPFNHNQIVSFIWGIADDCLREDYVRGKYRDVILPDYLANVLFSCVGREAISHCQNEDNRESLPANRSVLHPAAVASNEEPQQIPDFIAGKIKPNEDNRKHQQRNRYPE